MSADLAADPSILATHQHLRNPDSAVDWLYLGYTPDGPKDRLLLADSGEGGLDGLKSSLSQSHALNIHFGLLRLEGRVLLFTLLPDSTGGVKRARALVHSRAVGAKLQHHATLTVAKPADLTLNAVRSKLKLDTGSASSSLPPSPNPQLSAGTSIPSPYLQPSPLRSHFHPNGSAHSPHLNGAFQNDAPPPPPEKDSHTLLKVRSNASMRSQSQSTPPPFSPPTRQASRDIDSTSPKHDTDPRGRLSPTGLPRVHGGPHAPATVGLGLGAPIARQQGHQSTPPNAIHVLGPAEASHTPSQSPRSVSANQSPRLASLDFEREHRRYGSRNDEALSPSLSHMQDVTPQPGSRPISPAASFTSRMSATNSVIPQEVPLPLSAGPSVPNSARSLDPSTLDSMFRSSDSQESLADEIATASARASTSRLSSDVERLAIADSIARAAEQKWHAELNTTHGGTQVRGDSAFIKGCHGTSERIDGQNVERSDDIGPDAVPSATEARYQSQNNELNLPRKPETSGNGAILNAAGTSDIQQEQHQSEEAEQESRRLEAEEAAAARAAAEAEASRLKQEEEVRLAEEQAHLEAERLRQQEEEVRLAEERARLEAERLKQEEESRVAQEPARLAAEETARQERLSAKLQLRMDLRDRLNDASSDTVALTGFLSVQGGTSILWRRRYFQLYSGSLKLYKNAQEVSSAVDEVQLAGHVQRIDENAEDLMAIPHSFKLMFKDYDEEPYLFYCDEEDDKELLLYGLKVAAKLEVPM